MRGSSDGAREYPLKGQAASTLTPLRNMAPNALKNLRRCQKRGRDAIGRRRPERRPAANPSKRDKVDFSLLLYLPDRGQFDRRARPRPSVRPRSGVNRRKHGSRTIRRLARYRAQEAGAAEQIDERPNHHNCDQRDGRGPKVPIFGQIARFGAGVLFAFGHEGVSLWTSGAARGGFDARRGGILRSKRIAI